MGTPAIWKGSSVPRVCRVREIWNRGVRAEGDPMYLADAVSNCIEALFLFLNVSVPGTMTGKIEHETPELVIWSGIFKIARFVPASQR